MSETYDIAIAARAESFGGEQEALVREVGFHLGIADLGLNIGHHVVGRAARATRMVAAKVQVLLHVLLIL